MLKYGKRAFPRHNHESFRNFYRGGIVGQRRQRRHDDFLGGKHALHTIGSVANRLEELGLGKLAPRRVGNARRAEQHHAILVSTDDVDVPIVGANRNPRSLSQTISIQGLYDGM